MDGHAIRRWAALWRQRLQGEGLAGFFHGLQHLAKGDEAWPTVAEQCIGPETGVAQQWQRIEQTKGLRLHASGLVRERVAVDCLVQPQAELGQPSCGQQRGECWNHHGHGGEQGHGGIEVAAPARLVDLVIADDLAVGIGV